MRLTTPTLALAVALLCPPDLAAQSSNTSTFIILHGKDTTSFEQFTRAGNTVTGVWIAIAGQVQVHDYTLTLDAAGNALRYDMAVAFPDGAGHMPPSEAKYILEFGADSLTLTTGRANPVTRRVAIKGGTYPAVGFAAVERELKLTRMRAARADSTDFAFTQISGGGSAPAQVVPARFVGADSAIFGTTHYKVDKDGRLLGWRLANGDEARRVQPIDVKKYEVALISADSLAEATAKAKLVRLDAAAMDRLVGSYPLNANVMLTIARDGDKLTLRNGNRPAGELLAHSATLFSIGRAVSAQMIEFEVDAAGNATALVILAPGGLRQRVAKSQSSVGSARDTLPEQVALRVYDAFRRHDLDATYANYDTVYTFENFITGSKRTNRDDSLRRTKADTTVMRIINGMTVTLVRSDVYGAFVNQEWTERFADGRIFKHFELLEVRGGKIVRQIEGDRLLPPSS